MLLSSIFVFVWLTFLPLAGSAFFPATLPLAVRSPYLQTYTDTHPGDNTNNQWPQHWTLNRSLSWSGWIRIDGTALQLWGQFGPPTRLISFELTPTRTIYSIHANTMNVNVTFLSPIEPSDLVLQSLPFSYVYVDLESNDGQEHSVQLYSDISAEWISGNSASLAEWGTTGTASSTIHKATRQSPLSMQEINNVAEDATVYYAFPISNNATYQIGNETVVWENFITHGVLSNTVDIGFGAISDKSVMLGHAINLSNITSTTSSVVWAIGLVRDPAINLHSATGVNTSSRSSYFWTAYNMVSDAIDFFLDDFPNAKQRATVLDNKTMSDAHQISSDKYVDLITLTACQALAVDITVSKDTQGNWNTSDIMTFMKDVGDSRRVSPVEILYAAFPAYLYFNTSWAGYLLEPLLRYQQSSEYQASFAAPDLGSSYPNVEGNSNPSIFRAIEDSGNMLIMGWAHARFSGDISSISRYYDTYKKWADYLVSVSLSPNGYTDADGLSYTNMTNLVIKGIISIKAMSEISQTLGRSQDAESYSSTAQSYVEEWQVAAGSTGHLLSTYGPRANSSSWSLVYNLFADKLLGTGLVDSSIYSNQDTWYSHEASNHDTYGIQYDSGTANEAKSHWTMFAAGASSDVAVQEILVSLVHTKAGFNVSTGVFPLTYNLNNGDTISGRASPGQGAMFSLMVLSLKNRIVSDGKGPIKGNNHSTRSRPSNSGAIAGGVVGGLATLILLIFGILMYRRRQRRKQEEDINSHLSSSDSAASLLIPQPFDPYRLYATQSPSQPLHPGQQDASGGSYPQARHRSGKEQSSLSPGPTATTSHGSSAVNLSGRTNSDNDTSIQLRSEMENLRREVDEIRARGLYEPPPEYT